MLLNTLGLVLTFLIVSSCSTTGGGGSADSPRYRPIIPPSQDSKEPQFDTKEEEEQLSGPEKVLYDDIKASYGNEAHTKAIQQAKLFLKRYPRSIKVPQVHNIIGLVYLTKKDPLKAIYRFKKAIAAASEKKRLQQYIAYNLATAQYHGGQYIETRKTLATTISEMLNYRTRLKFHFLKSLTATKLKQHLEAAREILAASYLFSEVTSDQTRAAYVKQFSKSLDQLKNLVTIETLYADYRDSPVADHLLYRIGIASKTSGIPQRSETAFRALITQFPDSIYYSKAANYLRALQNSDVVDSKAIGVLLPMTGRFAKFGKRALQSIALAFDIYAGDAARGNVSLVVQDAGSTPQKAIAALDKLYFEHHVIGVIGPLLSKGIDKVSERAQELGVPMISLAQRPGVEGDFLFYSSVTPKNQSYEIARYAIETKGLKKFAIVYPQDNFGKQYSKHFWDAVEELGGEIVGVESYTPKETDFRTVVDKLSGLYYLDARQRELDELEKLREADSIKHRTHKTAHYFKLPPVVDYEAVFIPDEARTVGQILPTFAYRDVEEVHFLGISTWNSKRLMKRARDHLDNAVFVDSFYPDSPAPRIQQVAQKFKRTFNRKPTAIDAIAYDAAQLIVHSMLTTASGLSRYELRNRLSEIKGYPGLTGAISYEDGRFNRKLKILGFDKGREIVEASQIQDQEFSPTASFR